MALLAKRSLVAAKNESVVGTAETLLAANAVWNSYNASLSFDPEIQPRAGQLTMSRILSVPAGRLARLSFEVDIYGTPGWEFLLASCGFTEASGSIWTPSSVSSNWETATVGYYMDGKLFTLAGCMGTVTFNWTRGQVGRALFDYLGIWQAPSDTAILAPTLPLAASAAPRWAGVTTLTLASYEPRLNSLSIAVNNETSLLPDAKQAAAFHRAWIGGRNVVVTADPEEDLVATYDPHALLIASTEVALTNTYSSMTFSCPKLQYEGVNHAARDGVSALAVTMPANRNASAGDDELSITI